MKVKSKDLNFKNKTEYSRNDNDFSIFVYSFCKKERENDFIYVPINFVQ